MLKGMVRRERVVLLADRETRWEAMHQLAGAAVSQGRTESEKPSLLVMRDVPVTVSRHSATKASELRDSATNWTQEQGQGQVGA